MKREITEIRGIGLATAEVFKKNGYKSVGDLASASVLDIVAIPGFREARAAQVIASARELMATEDTDTPVQGTDQPPQKVKNKAGNKKKKKSKKTKSKEKKKNKSKKKQAKPKKKKSKGKNKKKNNKKSKTGKSKK